MKIIFLALLCYLPSVFGSSYLPTWESLDSRPLPLWYDDAKFGIFLHWGVFSVPSYGNEGAWFWNYWKSGSPDFVKFMKDQYPPSFTYQDFAPDFDAYLFDPNWWADLFEDAGAKYVVLTSKHHEGFTLWPSNYSFGWSAMDVGPQRDLVGDLAQAVRNRTDIRFGLYHSLFEWYNPLYLKDKANGYRTNQFVASKTMPELYELVNAYQPEVIWSDGDWEAPDTYWNSTGFLAWLYNESPVKNTVVVNDRWGSGDVCNHGGYYTCSDRYNPGVLIPHKWENCYTMDKNAWTYRRDATLSDFLSFSELIGVLAETVSCGGNLLLNVGPRKDGRIDPLMEERLRQLGRWLRINGDAIYGTKPWIHQNETKFPVWYTAKEKASSVHVFGIVLQWPSNGALYLSNLKPTDKTKVSMLGYSSFLPWIKPPGSPGIIVDLNEIPFADMPSTVAWTLKFDNLATNQHAVHPDFVAATKN